MNEHNKRKKASTSAAVRLLCLCCLALFSVQSTKRSEAAVDFEKDIRPILEENCWHCHGEDEQESGLRLDKRAMMLRGGDYGLPTLVPGHPEKSYLIEVVEHRDPDMAMPTDGDKLPEQQIELLRQWITEGAQWPGQMNDEITFSEDGLHIVEEKIVLIFVFVVAGTVVVVFCCCSRCSSRPRPRRRR